MPRQGLLAVRPKGNFQILRPFHIKCPFDVIRQYFQIQGYACFWAKIMIHSFGISRVIAQRAPPKKSMVPSQILKSPKLGIH